MLCLHPSPSALGDSDTSQPLQAALLTPIPQLQHPRGQGRPSCAFLASLVHPSNGFSPPPPPHIPQFIIPGDASPAAIPMMDQQLLPTPVLLLTPELFWRSLPVSIFPLLCRAPEPAHPSSAKGRGWARFLLCAPDCSGSQESFPVSQKSPKQGQEEPVGTGLCSQGQEGKAWGGLGWISGKR